MAKRHPLAYHSPHSMACYRLNELASTSCWQL